MLDIPAQAPAPGAPMDDVALCEHDQHREHTAAEAHEGALGKARTKLKRWSSKKSRWTRAR